MGHASSDGPTRPASRALQVCEGDVCLRAEHFVTSKRLGVWPKDGKLFGPAIFRLHWRTGPCTVTAAYALAG